MALLWAAVSLVILMTLVWLISERIQNAGIVDIVWAGGFAPLSWLYLAFAPDLHGPRLLFCGLVTLWSLRLAIHLGRRVRRHYPVEDGRYAAMRLRWGKKAALNMLEFFYLQALLMLLLSVPFWLILTGSELNFPVWTYVGSLIWLIAFLGETLADAQLDAFKADPKNKGGVCDSGLWRYSRHPNYFFEWLTWLAFYVYGLGFAWGWTSFYAPLLMLFFLLFLTGIRATEEQALKTKGEAYRHYQKRTSSFIPWFPKTL